MWVLFFIVILGPGQYEVNVLETYQSPQAESICLSEAKRVKETLQKMYPSATERDTFNTVCVKQKEKEA